MPGPAADVYALGVLLGQLLGPPEAAPVELLAVVRRATATLPADRYPSAAALADDLAAWLDGRPVLAHAYSPRELLARSLRAWRRPLLGLAAVLVAAGTVAGVAAARLAAERDRAVAAEVEARATAARLWSDRATAALRRDDRPEAVRAAREALALVPDPHARGALAAFPTAGSEAPAEAWPLPPCALGLRFAADGLGCLERDGVHLLDLRGAPQGHLALAASDVIAHGDGWRAITAEGVVAWDGPQGPHRPLGLRASRTGLVAGTPGGVVDRLRLHLLTDPPREVSPCPSSENLDTVVFGDGGRWWGVCSGGVAVRGEADGAWAPLGPAQPGLQRVVALALDGEEVLAGTLDGALVRFHADSGLVLGRQRTGLGAIARLAVAPGGGRVLAVDEAGAAWVGVPRAGASEGRLPVAGVRDARWATDRAALLATGSRLERWELGPSLVDAWQEPGGVSALAIAPAGDRVAVAVGPLLHVRRIEDGALLGRSELHGRVIKGVAWSPEGDRLATGAVDEGFGVAWARADASAHTYEASSEHRARSLDVDGEGRVFVTLWSLRFLSAPAVGAPLQSYPLPRMLTQLVGVPTGAGAWGLDEQGALWFVGTDLEPRPVPEVGGPARALALSGDGRRLAVAQDGHVAVYALDPVRLRARWPWEGELTALALDHTGARVALGDIHGAVQERTEEGALSWTAPGHTERVSALRATADGGWLSAGWDGRVRRWRGP
jgi:hypothetical protein